MKWIPINTPPEKPGKYMCFVPECKSYKEHWDEYYWNGKHFLDTSFMGRDRIVEVSHYMIIVKP